MYFFEEFLNTETENKILNYWKGGFNSFKVGDSEIFHGISENIKEGFAQIYIFDNCRVIKYGDINIKNIALKVLFEVETDKMEEILAKNFIIKEKTYISYLIPEKLPFIEADNCEIRRMNDRDREAFNDFKKRVPKRDDAVSFVELDHPVIFGCFVDNKIVSASSNLFFGDYIADLGVLTDNTYRKKGYGKKTVAKLCEYNIQNGKINQHRCTDDNIASFRVAKSLGFNLNGICFEFHL